MSAYPFAAYGLVHWFAMQDGVVDANRHEIEQECQWLDQAVQLLTEIQLHLSDAEVRGLRQLQRDSSPDAHVASNLVVNLLSDSMGAAINAVRLLLFGAHADAYALTRSAFEACLYAEYFSRHPETCGSYLELEAIIDRDPTKNLASELFKRKLSPSIIMNDLYEIDQEDRRGFYATLCSYGSHASPIRVGLRLSSPDSGSAVLAPVSRSTPGWSRKEWTKNGAVYLMAVTEYAIEIFFENFALWFASSAAWTARRDSLAVSYESVVKSAER